MPPSYAHSVSSHSAIVKANGSPESKPDQSADAEKDEPVSKLGLRTTWVGKGRVTVDPGAVWVTVSVVVSSLIARRCLSASQVSILQIDRVYAYMSQE